MILIKDIWKKTGKLVVIASKMDGYSLFELIMVIILASIATPAIVEMFNTVITKSHTSEIITIAEHLAIEQVEIILADKAGTSSGYGYDSITSSRYASVSPGSPFGGYTRTVTITEVSPGYWYKHKIITVTVSHPLISPIQIQTLVYSNTGL